VKGLFLTAPSCPQGEKQVVGANSKIRTQEMPGFL